MNSVRSDGESMAGLKIMIFYIYRYLFMFSVDFFTGRIALKRSTNRVNANQVLKSSKREVVFKLSRILL